MTAITPERTRPGPPGPPCLATGAAGGRLINILFAATIALFLLGLFTLGPIS
ncbi:MAG: hypothetical protein AB7J32_11345 [Pseudonocardia sp.]